MNEFMRLYKEKYHKRGWNLEIYHSGITDWTITVGYKSTHPKSGESIIHVQSCDMELAFALAQVALKEWLSQNEGGY